MMSCPLRYVCIDAPPFLYQPALPRHSPISVLRPKQQIAQFVNDILRPRPYLSPLKLLSTTNPRQNPQRPRQPALIPKPNIRVRPIPHHTRPAWIELEFPLDRRHHRLRGLAERYWAVLPLLRR